MTVSERLIERTDAQKNEKGKRWIRLGREWIYFFRCKKLLSGTCWGMKVTWLLDDDRVDDKTDGDDDGDENSNDNDDEVNNDGNET